MLVPMRWVVIAVSLYLVAAIAGTCYVVIEVLDLAGLAQDLAIGVALVVLVAPALWLLWRCSPTGARAVDRAHWQRHEQERVARRVAELRGDAQRERFIPLVERGFVLDDARLARWLVRLGELEAVPHRHPYVAELLAGRELSDEQIDYREFPERLATCPHLQPVEQALKREGQRPDLHGARHVHIGRQLQFDELRRRFNLGESVVAIDQQAHPRDDDVDHRLHCTACDSDIRGDAWGRPWPE